MLELTILQLFGFHIAVALGLFFMVNVLGRNSSFYGYETLMIFSEPGDSASFNIMFRIVTPVIMIIIIAAICYYIGADPFTEDLYLAVLYSIIFRLIFNVSKGRTHLLPWRRLIFQWGMTLLLAWLSYKHLISKKEYLLPDIKTIGNEIWLGIAGYLYVLSNSFLSEDSGAQERSKKYIFAKYNHLKTRYDSTINKYANSTAWEPIIYAVMVVEDFNRPNIHRLLERVAFHFGRAKSLGIMQVQTDKLISDEESIRLGIDRLNDTYNVLATKNQWRATTEYEKSLPDIDRQQGEEDKLIRSVLMEYNPSSDYANDVQQVSDHIRNEFYSKLKLSLHPDL